MAHSFPASEGVRGLQTYRGHRLKCPWRLIGSSTVGLCQVLASNTGGHQPQPFGGAIVAKLAGSAKLVRGEHHVVPLLGPGSVQQPSLPFGASVECFSRDSVKGLDLTTPSGTSSGALPGTGTSASDVAPASTRMLDVFFVIAGTGQVTSADGTVRSLHAGDSLIAWHNTTELKPISAVAPPVVLKFHFPASVLMLPPGSVVAPAPSHADLQILVDECQGDRDGELSPQEADDMMRGCSSPTVDVEQPISSYYDNPPSDLPQQQPNSAPSTQQPSSRTPWVGSWLLSATSAALSRAARSDTAAPMAAATMPLGAADHGWEPAFSSASTTAGSGTPSMPPLSNNAAPVAPFPRRPLHTSSAPGFSVVRLLRSLLGLPQQREHQQIQQQPQPPAMAAAGAGAAAEGGSAPQPRRPSGCVLLQRALRDFKAFRFPSQTNRLAFVFDPAELGLSLSLGVEVFEPGHRTPLHTHRAAHELFFVLAGEGRAHCNGAAFPVRAGDCLVFPPRAVHGLDNVSGSRLYCLQLMTPDEAFVEHVKSGEAVGGLDEEDISNLVTRHC